MANAYAPQMRTAVEKFDTELAWQMHCCACTYAQELKLHQVDDAHDVSGAPVRDADRKGFWELVQVDLYFRLVHGKPATLTASMDSWKVNLPWLSGGMERSENTNLSIQFLMSSRITFSIIEFFHLLDGADSETELEQFMDKVEQICMQAENISTEWNLVRLFQGGICATWKIIGQILLTRGTGGLAEESVTRCCPAVAIFRHGLDWVLLHYIYASKSSSQGAKSG